MSRAQPCCAAVLSRNSRLVGADETAAAGGWTEAASGRLRSPGITGAGERAAQYCVPLLLRAIAFRYCCAHAGRLLALYCTALIATVMGRRQWPRSCAHVLCSHLRGCCSYMRTDAHVCLGQMLAFDAHICCASGGRSHLWAMHIFSCKTKQETPHTYEVVHSGLNA